MKRIQIWWLKRRARVLLLAYDSKIDSLSCGESFAQHLPSVSKLRYGFNNTMDRLSKLDDHCTNFRLPDRKQLLHGKE